MKGIFFKPVVKLKAKPHKQPPLGLLPIIDFDALRDRYLSTEALQWKRNNPGQLRP